MLLAEVIIPQMFTAYAEDLDYMDNGLHKFQYFCQECEQSFMAAWGRIPGMPCWMSERGSHFRCPHCGKKHKENVVKINHKVAAPNEVRLAVHAFERIINFVVSSSTIEFRGDMQVARGTYKETFRFDLSKQVVLFSKVVNGINRESFEIGNPFHIEVLGKSILRYFEHFSLANSIQKKELSRILKVLREAVHQRLEKHLGHKIASMFVSPGQTHGTFLLPLFNMAYRVMCPDAPNLPVAYRESERAIEAFWKTKMINIFDCYMDEVIANRHKKNFVTSMIEANSLPDRPYSRRIISEKPFEVRLLHAAFRLCSNYDYAVRMFEALQKLSIGITATPNKSLINFLRKMKVIYGELRIVRLVENYQEMQLWDCVNLFNQLNKENRKGILIESVRLRDLHDWMSIRHKKQTHINLKFEVPDHIVKRLSMQRDRLNFFLPKESMQLLEAGHELHNCVASYGQAMKDNKKWIVLVADKNGKLAACLEINGKELVQAKLDRNKPVLNNPELNKAILVWAREANIKINTSDIKIPEKKKLSVPA